MQTPHAPHANARVARRQHEQAAARQKRLVTVAAGVIVLVLVALVLARVISSRSAPAAVANTPAPPELVAQVTGVPAATLEQVGRGTANNLPTPVRATLERGPGGLPLVTYVGAEY